MTDNSVKPTYDDQIMIANAFIKAQNLTKEIVTREILNKGFIDYEELRDQVCLDGGSCIDDYLLEIFEDVLETSEQCSGFYFATKPL
ncbi:TPA: hypothetical protein DEP21_04620 [Patescibacteria group bacterium]|nr:hypothetical protein [Candidatus Gracilibacteria bacterium]